MNFLFNTPELTCWANDNDGLIPEIWAMEALRTLKSNMVMGALVNRDYDSAVANFGDIVNTSRPADFTGTRKVDSDSVTVQDAQSTTVQVPLNQHFHVSYTIKDGEMSKALPDLVERYVEPAAREIAEKVDQVLCGQVVRLTGTSDEGKLTEMTSTTADDYILDAMAALDVARCPKPGRKLVLGPRAQKAALGAGLFVSAEQRGDGGTALENAVLGRVYGFDTYMDQNMSYVALGSADYGSGATDNIEAAGSTVVETTVAASAGDIVAGCYVWIAGDGKPYRVSSLANDPLDITLTSGLQVGCAAAAAVRVFKKGEVDLTAGYAAGWPKPIVCDGHNANKGPQVGQWVTFGTGASSHSYTIIDVTVVSTTESQIVLDRPLETAIADGDSVFYGPNGGFNLAFHKDAMTLVSRPLATPPARTGVDSFVAEYDGLAMRVTMQYLGQQQGMLVTFDLLCGVAVLNAAMACPVYS
jgi:hypothetical protein